jgi:hypothetical protein
MDERRRVPRMKDESNVAITIVSKDIHQDVIHDRIQDISVHGAKIHSHLQFPVDSLLEIDFISNLGKKITAVGKVKWIKVIIEDKSYDLGVEFVDTTGEAIKKLEDYISWKQKRISLNQFGVMP